ncbi:hypothetical protein LB518_09540 [Mesorhizobium sp. BR1-1-16]|uniref:hypothetical protein n=1 Tax=Mesorhizobium sp. BR1-1-16 TaxID=2876653 RepID=UPI001CD039EA|nr:hypothetical protein [Mesorhizobium sp. BR1-1-16]MBZ9936537.1 hypothetical protein [Mesorhizobium sp. BR1-1-16]HWJ74649.1 hypothetical protein [Kaistia sp.]
MQKKLVALRGRLVEEQQKLIMQAASSGVLPTDSAVRKISDIENAIMAVEHMIEELGTTKAPAKSAAGKA